MPVFASVDPAARRNQAWDASTLPVETPSVQIANADASEDVQRSESLNIRPQPFGDSRQTIAVERGHIDSHARATADPMKSHALDATVHDSDSACTVCSRRCP